MSTSLLLDRHSSCGGGGLLPVEPRRTRPLNGRRRLRDNDADHLGFYLPELIFGLALEDFFCRFGFLSRRDGGRVGRAEREFKEQTYRLGDNGALHRALFNAGGGSRRRRSSNEGKESLVVQRGAG